MLASSSVAPLPARAILANDENAADLLGHIPFRQVA